MPATVDNRFFPVPCPVLRLAADGTVLALNAAAVQLFGGGVAARKWADLCPDGDVTSDEGTASTLRECRDADGARSTRRYKRCAMAPTGTYS